MNTSPVLVVDQRSLLAETLAQAISQHAQFTAFVCTTYAEVERCLASFVPRIVIINIHLDTVDEGMAACRTCTRATPYPLIVLVAPQRLVAGSTFMVDAVEEGAAGVLIHEELNLADFLVALEKLDAGDSLLDPQQLREALEHRRIELDQHPSGVDALTDREREVMELVMTGISTSDVATQLHLSERTVQHHISNVLSKIGVRSRTEAIARLYQWQVRQHA